MLLATCSDPGFWRSASGLARTHRFVSQSILSVVCSSVTPSPAAAMALKPDSFSPLTPRLKLTSLLSSTSPAENLPNIGNSIWTRLSGCFSQKELSITSDKTFAKSAEIHNTTTHCEVRLKLQRYTAGLNLKRFT